jgi:hypothetical protein
MIGLRPGLRIAALTFCAGVAIDRGFVNVQPEVHTEPSAASEVRPSPNPIPESKSITDLVSQDEIVRFPGTADVRVRALEKFSQGLELKFTNAVSGAEITTAYLGGSNWNWSKDEWSPRLRFKSIRVKGLPNPLVVGVAENPGVSDSLWQAVAVGKVGDDLEELTFEQMETTNQGGFYFGDLGQGMGPGAAVWDFVWGEDEGHYSLHHYEIRLFKWNGRRFEWYKVMRTRREYEFGKQALREYGLRYEDLRNSIPDFHFPEEE